MKSNGILYLIKLCPRNLLAVESWNYKLDVLGLQRTSKNCIPTAFANITKLQEFSIILRNFLLIVQQLRATTSWLAVSSINNISSNLDYYPEVEWHGFTINYNFSSHRISSERNNFFLLFLMEKAASCAYEAHFVLCRPECCLFLSRPTLLDIIQFISIRMRVVCCCFSPPRKWLS